MSDDNNYDNGILEGGWGLLLLYFTVYVPVELEAVTDAGGASPQVRYLMYVHGCILQLGGLGGLVRKACKAPDFWWA